MGSASCVNTTVLVFGILELLMGLGLIACGGMEIKYQSRYYKFYHGLWSGGLVVMTACFAIYAGLKQARGMHIAHMVCGILFCIFILPGTGVLFGLERVHDYYYSYYTDDSSYCYNCFWGVTTLNSWNSDSYNTYNTYNSYNSLSNSVNNLKSTLSCQDIFTTQFCHQNTKAFKIESAALAIGGLLFLSLIISASLTCCAVCSCCGTNRRLMPAGAIGVYPIATSTVQSGYPAVSNDFNGWNNQPVSYSQAPYSSQPATYGYPPQQPAPQTIVYA